MGNITAPWSGKAIIRFEGDLLWEQVHTQQRSAVFGSCVGPLEEADAIGLTSILFTKFKLIRMACRDDEAVEMVSIMENWLCDAIAAQN